MCGLERERRRDEADKVKPHYRDCTRLYQREFILLNMLYINIDSVGLLWGKGTI